MSGVPIATVLCYWVFWQHLRVRLEKCVVYLIYSLIFMNLIANKKYEKDALFQKYQWQLFHSSLAKILELLKPGMTTPEVVCCPDRHF